MPATHLVEHLHQGQKRKTGEKYTSHLYAVQNILKAEGIKEKTILEAALLHDILEDSRISKDYLAYRFGDRVADIVEFLTKNRAWNTSYCRAKSNLDEMENAWVEYPEAALIKMADRLHNLQTITGFSPQKQHEYLAETNECLLPLFARILKRNHLGYLKTHIRSLFTHLKKEVDLIAHRLSLTSITYGHQH